VALPRGVAQLPGHPARQFGFTLVELIIVMVVIGVLGAVAAPRFFQRQGFDAVTYADQVRSVIRYGQKLAIAQNRNVFVRLDGASVALCYDAPGTCAQRVQPASGTNSGSSATLQRCGNATAWACEGVPAGLSITAHPNFFFDPSGEPFLAAGGSLPTQTVAVTGDGLNHNVIVTTQTGYVY
jgi:MSHA pilin protein MshC